MMSPWRSVLAHGYYWLSQPYRQCSNGRAAAAGKAAAIVLYYHRVADDRANAWTISNGAFARQIDWLAARFDMVSLDEARRRIAGTNDRPCVSVTFDDGYSENCRHAIPLLVKRRVPCTYFTTLGNVLSGEPYLHDVRRGDRFLPNSVDELRAMAAAGIEIGAHTFSHPNLAQVTDPAEMDREVVAVRAELAALVGRPVRYFAFPFGQREHLHPAAFAAARRAGYEAACSAYGGYNFPGDDPFHIQRIAADESMIRLKNWATIDPRKVSLPRYPAPPADEPALVAAAAETT